MHPSRHWSTMSSCRMLFLAVLYWVGILTCPWSTPAKMQFSLFLPHQTLDASEQYLDLAFIPLLFQHALGHSFTWMNKWVEEVRLIKDPGVEWKFVISCPVVFLLPSVILFFFSNEVLLENSTSVIVGIAFDHHHSDSVWPNENLLHSRASPVVEPFPRTFAKFFLLSSFHLFSLPSMDGSVWEDIFTETLHPSAWLWNDP